MEKLYKRRIRRINMDKVAVYNRRKVKYDASTSEILLEEMCLSFGTELLPGIIEGINTGLPILYRLSRPAIVGNIERDRRLVQFQHTRFSPMHNFVKFSEVYRQNTQNKKSERLTDAKIAEEVAEVYETNPVGAVTKTQHVSKASIHRWPKGVYVAVYNTDEKQDKPFKVHEPFGLPGEGRLPMMHLHLDIQPFFVINEHQENTSNPYDHLWITFPEITRHTENSISSALKAIPLNKLNSPENAFIEEGKRMSLNYRIHVNVPRQATMGFIHSYLKQYLQGRTLA